MTRRFFYDTEFIEEPGYLDLISIGIVDEDGNREFYAGNADCNFDRANDWVRKNVYVCLPPICRPGFGIKYLNDSFDFEEHFVNDPGGFWFRKKYVVR